jgi:sulfide:quinone oxidoreductase
MYIFEDRMRRAGLREKTQITFMQGMPTIFGIKK